MDAGIFKLLDRTSSLRVDKSGDFTSPNLEIVTAVVLMYVAKSDNRLSQLELQALQASLARHFHLPDEESAHVLEVAEYLLRHRSGVKEFTEIIKSNFEESQRRTILALLWKIMSADGLVSTLEASATSELVSLMGLTAEDLAEAKQMASLGKV